MIRDSNHNLCSAAADAASWEIPTSVIDFRSLGPGDEMGTRGKFDSDGQRWRVLFWSNPCEAVSEAWCIR